LTSKGNHNKWLKNNKNKLSKNTSIYDDEFTNEDFENKNNINFKKEINKINKSYKKEIKEKHEDIELNPNKKKQKLNELKVKLEDLKKHKKTGSPHSIDRQQTSETHNGERTKKLKELKNQIKNLTNEIEIDKIKFNKQQKKIEYEKKNKHNHQRNLQRKNKKNVDYRPIVHYWMINEPFDDENVGRLVLQNRLLEKNIRQKFVETKRYPIEQFDDIKKILLEIYNRINNRFRLNIMFGCVWERFENDNYGYFVGSTDYIFKRED